MQIFNKVAIIGTGLIGGSLALVLKKGRLCGQIIGISRHKKTLEFARKNKIIDFGSQDISVIRDADLVILAAPPQVIRDLAPKIGKIIKDNCVVTDVASIKKEIVTSLDRIFPLYLGSHPLAGMEKRGIRNADAGIFKDSLCILTPTNKTSPQALKKIQSLWRALGVTTAAMTPAEHDRILSFVSHLPHLAAFSLMDAIPERLLGFSAGGLKDTTRIAASDAELWADIMLGNRKEILCSARKFENSLKTITSCIRRMDKRSLTAILKSSQAKREKLNFLKKPS